MPGEVAGAVPGEVAGAVAGEAAEAVAGEAADARPERLLQASVGKQEKALGEFKLYFAEHYASQEF